MIHNWTIKTSPKILYPLIQEYRIAFRIENLYLELGGYIECSDEDKKQIEEYVTNDDMKKLIKKLVELV